MIRRLSIAVLIACGAAAALVLWLMLRPCGWDGRLGRFDDPVAALIFSEGEAPAALWIGGYFLEVDGIPTGAVVRWDGEQWHPSDAFNGPVRAMKALDSADLGADGARGQTIVVAGQFTRVRGIPMNYIARRDGERWTTFANGFDHWVTSLAAFDAGDDRGRNLYAGGHFTRAGDAEVHHIARWNGRAWEPVDGGVNGPVHALRVHETDGKSTLVVGGAFTRAGEIEAKHIAAWDGREWIDLGGGFDRDVLALETIASGPARGLYAGGRFTSAGGDTANRIARWDDTASRWRPLGEGVDLDVHAMAGLGESLIVGGRFQRAGSVAVSRIARWDGEQWSALGRGTDGPVHALLVDPNDDRLLYIGGNFSRAGRRTANHLATWRACP